MSLNLGLTNTELYTYRNINNKRVPTNVMKINISTRDIDCHFLLYNSLLQRSECNKTLHGCAGVESAITPMKLGEETDFFHFLKQFFH